MVDTAILMGGPPTSGMAGPARIIFLFALSAGLLIALLPCLSCGGWSGARTETQEPSDSPREWLWGWGVVFLLNLPLPLFFGFLLTSETATFGMLAGVVVVWLIGHFAVSRVREVRGALVVGG